MCLLLTSSLTELFSFVFILQVFSLILFLFIALGATPPCHLLPLSPCIISLTLYPMLVSSNNFVVAILDKSSSKGHETVNYDHFIELGYTKSINDAKGKVNPSTEMTAFTVLQHWIDKNSWQNQYIYAWNLTQTTTNQRKPVCPYWRNARWEFPIRRRTHQSSNV